jgi:hypothetical protein
MMKSAFDPTTLAASLDDDNIVVSERATGTRPDSVIRDDLNMRIARDGTWFYHGSPISRKPLVRLFASVLSRDDDGVYWLTTPVEKGRVEVDDAPFLAVAVEVTGTGKNQLLRFRTSLDHEITAGPENPLRVELDPATLEPSPYVLVQGRLEALIARSLFYELVELGHEELIDGKAEFGVWSDGCFFTIGDMDAMDVAS